MAYCETTRIEEFSQAFKLHIKLDELLLELFDLCNKTLGSFINLTNITDNQQLEIDEGSIDLTDKLQTN